MYSKKIDHKNRLFKTRFFPASFTPKHRFQNSVYLGIGGNVGDTMRLFARLIHFLHRDRLLELVESSPILKNPPFGYLQQNDFYNAVIKVTTPLEPKMLLNHLLHIEHQFRRKRPFKDAPRTLDIDILFYNDLSMEDRRLIIPHPHWYKRDSVVIPLRMMRGLL